LDNAVAPADVTIEVCPQHTDEVEKVALSCQDNQFSELGDFGVDFR
jgi:hypothetical protein